MPPRRGSRIRPRRSWPSGSNIEAAISSQGRRHRGIPPRQSSIGRAKRNCASAPRSLLFLADATTRRSQSLLCQWRAAHRRRQGRARRRHMKDGNKPAPASMSSPPGANHQLKLDRREEDPRSLRPDADQRRPSGPHRQAALPRRREDGAKPRSESPSSCSAEAEEGRRAHRRGETRGECRQAARCHPGGRHEGRCRPALQQDPMAPPQRTGTRKPGRCSSMRRASRTS